MQVRILLTSNLLTSSALPKRRFPAEGETPFAYLIRSLAHTCQYMCALMIVVLSWMADFNLWHQDAGDMYDDEYGCYQWFKDKIFESNSQQIFPDERLADNYLLSPILFVVRYILGIICKTMFRSSPLVRLSVQTCTSDIDFRTSKCRFWSPLVREMPQTRIRGAPLTQSRLYTPRLRNT